MRLFSVCPQNSVDDQVLLGMLNNAWRKHYNPRMISCGVLSLAVNLWISDDELIISMATVQIANGLYKLGLSKIFPALAFNLTVANRRWIDQ
ncbi:hypothetical protein PoB_002699800 [Plakobranchus ocellatus]|uniref:Uncharacterized protein n=1 Tax=Plakobranchus ocellatus TaxID=259542 RepID=A0AAV4A1J2_9GAST|nr:hypothetical protein PoB_002699800 [Plakobranchus ocellatus]